MILRVLLYCRVVYIDTPDQTATNPFSRSTFTECGTLYPTVGITITMLATMDSSHTPTHTPPPPTKKEEFYPSKITEV